MSFGLVSLTIKKMEAAPIRIDRKPSIETEPKTLGMDQIEFARVLMLILFWVFETCVYAPPWQE